MQTRREFLFQSGGGLGGIALAAMLGRAESPRPDGGVHHKPKAKRVVQLFMAGGASHIDLFDFKPELAKRHGQPADFGEKVEAFQNGLGPWLKPLWEFKPYGKCGKQLSEVAAPLGSVVDEMAFVHNVVGKTGVHSQGTLLQSTGFNRPGFPSMGCWVSYGLGSANENLPAFVVLPDHRGLASNGTKNWDSAFLPAQHQGCSIYPGAKNPIEDLFPDERAKFITAGSDKAGIELLAKLNREHAGRRGVTRKTLDTYTDYFKSFNSRHPRLLVRDLRPFHVRDWWDTCHQKWGNSTRNLSGSALKAAFRWAAAPGKGGAIIPQNPLEGMSLPTMRKRSAEVVVSEDEFGTLLGLVKSATVRDILTVAWETGTRPVNLSRATASNLMEGGNALMFADWNTEAGNAVHKTFTQTGRPLVVPLSDAAREIVLRLVVKHPEGPIFRTPSGLPWNELRLANTVLHYATRAGLKGRFTAYSCRHTRATALLEQGHSDTDVAAILGNTPAVIHRNYSHVAAKVDRLRDLLNRSRKATET